MVDSAGNGRKVRRPKPACPSGSNPNEPVSRSGSVGFRQDSVRTGDLPEDRRRTESGRPPSCPAGSHPVRNKGGMVNPVVLFSPAEVSFSEFFAIFVGNENSARDSNNQKIIRSLLDNLISI